MRQFYFRSALVTAYPDRVVVRYKAWKSDPIELKIGGVPVPGSFTASSPVIMTVVAPGVPGVIPDLPAGGPNYPDAYFEAVFVGACTIARDGAGLVVSSEGQIEPLDDVENSFPFTLAQLTSASRVSLLAQVAADDQGPHKP